MTQLTVSSSTGRKHLHMDVLCNTSEGLDYQLYSSDVSFLLNCFMVLTFLHKAKLNNTLLWLAISFFSIFLAHPRFHLGLFSFHLQYCHGEKDLLNNCKLFCSNSKFGQKENIAYVNASPLMFTSRKLWARCKRVSFV